METIEKSDVDISKLFTWSKKVEVPYLDGLMREFHMRVIGDEDLNRARVYSLRYGAELRNKLWKEDSDERIGSILDKDLVDKNTMIELTIHLRMSEFTKEVVTDLVMKLPKEPETRASLEKQEEYQEKVDNYPRERAEKINQGLQERVKKERANLKKLSFEKLYDNYVRAQINLLVEKEFQRRYSEFIVWASLYNDEEFKDRAFESVEKFNDLPRVIKDMLVQEYSELDITMTDLKK